MARVIVAFGDGNTRYFLGDENQSGPYELAWPAQMEDILLALGVKVKVRNEGRPGEPAAAARASFAEVIRGADLCVVGFGMEDIRHLERTMAFYLSEMEDVLRQGKSMGVPIILLGIPWFDEDWGGALVQGRLPKWNEGLRLLSETYRVPFIDLYEALGDDPDRWYSEKKTPRHSFSAAGQRRVAEIVLPAVLDYIH